MIWNFGSFQIHKTIWLYVTNNDPNSWCFLLIISREIFRGKWTAAVCQSFTWRGKWAFTHWKNLASFPFSFPLQEYDCFWPWNLWRLTLTLRPRCSSGVNHAISLREQKMMLMRKASGQREAVLKPCTKLHNELTIYIILYHPWKGNRAREMCSSHPEIRSFGGGSQQPHSFHFCEKPCMHTQIYVYMSKWLSSDFGVSGLFCSQSNNSVCSCWGLQFSSVTRSCPTLFDPMDGSTPGLPVHHRLPDFAQTHVHRVSDAIQLSHPLLSPSPPAFNHPQHQGLFQWVTSSHQVAKGLKFQLQHQPFQWIFSGLISFMIECLNGLTCVVFNSLATLTSENTPHTHTQIWNVGFMK